MNLKRKNLRIVLVGGMALAIGLAAALLLWRWWATWTAHIDSTEEQSCVQVCMVTRSLLRGEVISSEDLQVVTWIAELAPEQVCTSPEQVVGKCVSHALPARSLLTTFDLGACDHQLIIPPGCDAVSVEASPIKAVAGAIAPGSFVDMYCHRDGQTYLLLEQIKVLDIAPDSSWITVALQPDRVQEVIAASAAKSLYFTKPGTPGQNNQESSKPTHSSD